MVEKHGSIELINLPEELIKAVCIEGGYKSVDELVSDALLSFKPMMDVILPENT